VFGCFTFEYVDKEFHAIITSHIFIDYESEEFRLKDVKVKVKSKYMITKIQLNGIIFIGARIIIIFLIIKSITFIIDFIFVRILFFRTCLFILYMCIVGY